jgi:hypothetical protein
MLSMALAGASLGGMAVLGILMGAERVYRSDRRLTVAVGLLMLGWGLLVAWRQ